VSAAAAEAGRAAGGAAAAAPLPWGHYFESVEGAGDGGGAAADRAWACELAEAHAALVVSDVEALLVAE
jgi:hypothetical protein